MVTSTPPATRAWRLNPFAFPMETDLRFILLIIAVLGASLLGYNLLYFRLHPMEYLATITRCNDEVNATFGDPSQSSPPVSSGGLGLLDQRRKAMQECTAAVDRAIGLTMLTGLLVVFGLGVVIYWLFPLWTIRRQGLEPLSADDAPEVVASLADLVREAGLTQVPTFLWNPHNLGVTGLAFGRLGRPYVMLTGGLVTQFYTDPAAFRAIILHELAHLRNGDVGKAYFAVAAWWAFVIGGLTPLAFFIVGGGSTWAVTLNLAWRAILLAALVFLTRNAVLRVREVYADLQASRWEGTQSALRRVLADLPGGPSRWQRAWLQPHPAPEVRRQTLDDTRRLFQMGLREAVGIGLVAAVALEGMTSVLYNVLPPDWRWTSPLIAGAPFMGAAMGSLGIAVWRQTFLALAQGAQPGDGGRLALGLGLGVGLGQRLAFHQALVDSLEATSGAGVVDRLVFDIVWTALLVLGLVIWLRWVAVMASVWLRSSVTHTSPRRAYLPTLLLAVVLCLVWFGGLLYLRAARDYGLLGIAWLVIGQVAGPLLPFFDIVTLIALFSAWAVPLLARRWAQPGPTTSLNWALLDSATPLSLPAAPLPSLRPTLRFALRAGLTCVAALVVLRLVGLALLSPQARQGQAYLAVRLGLQGLFMVAQIGVALVVAARSPRLGALYGLCASSVMGVITTLGVIGWGILYDCIDPLPTAAPGFCLMTREWPNDWIIFKTFMIPSLLLTLPVVWVTAWWTGRRQREATRPAEAGAPS